MNHQVWKWTAGSLAIMGLLSGCGTQQAAHTTPVSTTEKTISAPVTKSPLATMDFVNGFMKPYDVKPLFAHQIVNASGQTIQMPTTKPLLFFAWWCPHCHAALKNLQQLGDLKDVELVSVYLDANGKTVTTLAQAKALTASGLHEAGISVPASAIDYVMPTSPINNIIQGVPMIVGKVDHTWVAMDGEPTHPMHIWADVIHRVRG
ncbi:TlpA family protein disulfide reductase [Sulfoacidibacillus ferrooxidans]|uniref:Thioredoxin domain-containing protein n=1 Tax=Sulfoacidibacillus ferrooxidans TaxID=2005001 RepID=A0A9X2AE72_9BACL|nr:hypothetical protein [Sulfoacidibacillus ferrooxidans]MCI0184255.1 hypothetical protein [Sulfoacidibacillus ferrooxidans]